MKRVIIALLAALMGFSFSPAGTITAAETGSVVSQDKKKDVKKQETVTFKATIQCKSCVKKITENISFEKGVKDLKVNLEEKLVTITYDPSKTSEETLASAIKKLGYEVETVKESSI